MDDVSSAVLGTSNEGRTRSDSLRISSNLKRPGAQNREISDTIAPNVCSSLVNVITMDNRPIASVFDTTISL